MDETEQKTWGLVPKPRSAIKTLEWFPSLLEVEGGFWNKTDNKGQRPVRREYLKLAHPFDEYNENDPEVNARMEFARYQTLGLAYLDTSGGEDDARVVITKAGYEIATNEYKDEVLLRQLLKLQFPSNIHSSARHQGLRVFPLEVFIKIVDHFGSLSILETALSVFACENIDELGKAIEKVEVFRSSIKAVEAKEYKKVFEEKFKELNPGVTNQPDTYINYADVFFRHLEYTSIFEVSGRGEFTKIYVPERSKVKFKQLSESYQFHFYDDYENTVAFYEYFGDPYVNRLPWESPEKLEEIIDSKVKLLDEDEFSKKLQQIDKTNYKEIKKFETDVNAALLEKNEREYVNNISKTQEARAEIISKFEDIDSGDEDEAALWLEVNTWRSLVAMKGRHYVKRNFRLEPDLSPRSFAKGTNKTPDMELYNEKYIIIPEVSIQSGVQQWVTEGSSVVEHVYKFMEIKNGKRFAGIEEVEAHMNTENIEAVFGFFLCRRVNERLMWQMYVLGREAWIGEPVTVVPMEISRYITILKVIYENDLPAVVFEEMIEKLGKSVSKCGDYHGWEVIQNEIINEFISSYT